MLGLAHWVYIGDVMVDNKSFLSRFRNWWSSDCSPWEYGGKCGMVTGWLILLGGWLVSGFEGTESDTLVVLFLLMSGAIGFVITLIIIGLLTWVLRRLKWQMSRVIEQSLIWWFPLYQFMSFYRYIS
mgnify:CR=1 FL=1